MNTAIIMAYWRERFGNPLVIVFLTMSVVASIAPLFFWQKGLSGAWSVIVIILSAGCIGRDVSAGTLALIFTRPIKRSEYVVSKWIAAASASAAVFIVIIAVQSIYLSSHRQPITLDDLFRTSVGAISLSFGLSAVFVLLSSLVNGFADVGIWFLGTMIATAGPNMGIPDRVAEELGLFLTPQIDWAVTFGATPISWTPLVTYASSVTLCIALAIVAVNRKELSYGIG